MFTNLILFSAAGDMPTLDELAEAMQDGTFSPPLPTQPSSSGWVPPRGPEHGALIESIGNHWIATVMIERRMLPASVVKRRLAQAVKDYEKTTGRKPGKRMLKEMKEEATLARLPQAFTKQTRVPVWIDPKRKLIVVDAGSAGRAQVAMEALIAAAPRMNLHGLRTVDDPGACMTHWLATNSNPEGFGIEREIELRGIGEAPAVISLTDAEWTEDDVKTWIEAGLRVSKLGLTFAQRVTFKLHSNGHLKGVEFLGGALNLREANAADFDGTFTLIAGELLELLEPLIASMGGIAPLPIEAAAADDATADTEDHDEEQPA